MYDLNLTELFFRGSVFYLLCTANKRLIVSPYIKKSRQQYKLSAALCVVRDALSVQFSPGHYNIHKPRLQDIQRIH